MSKALTCFFPITHTVHLLLYFVLTKGAFDEEQYLC